MLHDGCNQLDMQYADGALKSSAITFPMTKAYRNNEKLVSFITNVVINVSIPIN